MHSARPLTYLEERNPPMPTAQDVYADTVRSLPAVERLRLAALILDDLTRTEPAEGDTWPARDQAELAAFSLSYAEALYPENGELVEHW